MVMPGGERDVENPDASSGDGGDEIRSRESRVLLDLAPRVVAPAAPERAAAAVAARHLGARLGGARVVGGPFVAAVLLDVASPAAGTRRLGHPGPACLAGLAGEADGPAGMPLAPHVIRPARRAVELAHQPLPARGAGRGAAKAVGEGRTAGC